jgi:hypothetical protein
LHQTFILYVAFIDEIVTFFFGNVFFSDTSSDITKDDEFPTEIAQLPSRFVGFLRYRVLQSDNQRHVCRFRRVWILRDLNVSLPECSEVGVIDGENKGHQNKFDSNLWNLREKASSKSIFLPSTGHESNLPRSENEWLSFSFRDDALLDSWWLEVRVLYCPI